MGGGGREGTSGRRREGRNEWEEERRKEGLSGRKGVNGSEVGREG